MSICIRNVIRAARFPWSGPSAPIRATGFKFFCATLKICSRAFHELLAVPAATVPRALVKHSRSVCPRDYRNSAHCDHPNPSENLSIRNVGKDHVIVTLSKSRKNVDERRVCDMPVGGVIHLGWMSTSLKIPSWRDDSNFEATNLPSSRISWPQSDTQPISQLLGKWNMRMLLEVHQLLPWHWLWWNNCCQSPSPIIDLPSSLLKPTARWVAENGWHGGDMHTAFSTWGSKYLKKTHLSLASHWKIILGSWKYVLFLCLFSNLHQTTFERLRVILTDVRLMMNAPPGTCWQAMSIYYFHCLGAPAEPTKTNPQNSWRALQSFYWLMFSSLAIQKIDPSPPTKELAPPQRLHCIEAPVYQIETCEHRCCFQLKTGFISMMTYLSGRCRFFMTQAPWIISTSTTAWSSNWWLILPHLEIIPVTLSMQGQGKIW